MTAAELIRSARARRGLSQSALAARAGTSQPVISAYENGHRSPTLGTLRRLLAAAGARLEVGLGSEPPDLPPPVGPEGHAARLLDVLLLAEAVRRPRRRARDLAMPRMVSTG